MLKKTYHSFQRKDIPVPPLMASTQKEVLVQRFDPITGNKLSDKRCYYPSTEKLSDYSFVSNESADLYSIENMSKVGLKPVFAGSNYIKAGLDKFDDVENASIDLLEQLETSSQTPSSESVKEEPKTE